MTNGLQVSIDNLIRQYYCPFAKLTDMLRSFLQVAITITDSSQGEICLKDVKSGNGRQEGEVMIVDSDTSEPVSQRSFDKKCTVCPAFLKGNRSDPLFAGDLRSGIHCVRVTLPCGSSIAVPIRYQGTNIGVMALPSNSKGFYSKPHTEACQLIARETAHHVKRYELSQIIKAKLGKNLMLVGISDALRRVDEFIEKASQANLPVLITGEFGCQKRHVARDLHFAGPRRDNPFIKVNCSALDSDTFESELADLFSQADKGTIFFDGVDELEYRIQCRLSEILESGIQQWMSRANQEKPADVRIEASAGRDLDEMVKEGRFSLPLLEQLDFLTARLVPLRERKEDIKPLIEYFLRKYADGETRTISEEVLDLLEAYDWPRNVSELEHVIARLAAMSEEQTIKKDDVCAVAPELRWQQSKDGGYDAGQSLSREFANGKKVQQKNRIDLKLMLFAQDLINGEFAALRKFHPGIQKAMKYLAQNFEEEITLGQLAEQACLSASHLCYLFQKTLGVSFKTILAIVQLKKRSNC